MKQFRTLAKQVESDFPFNAETKGIRSSEKRANEKRHTYFCEPRMKTFFKRLSDAIKKVAHIKANGWNSLFVIVFENNEYRIAFKTENENNVVWSE
jgi:hypothetical protein